MSELQNALERLGLSQYLQSFTIEGFDTWETLTDITESDLDSLGVKLGHRRKLQRAIVDARGYAKTHVLLGSLHPSSEDAHSRTNDGGGSAVPDAKQQANTDASRQSIPAKRKYRRHPKVDEHAPERPPSAYVLFSNHIRETLKGQDLSFTEIAKIVGERWQELSVADKRPCEQEAHVLKDQYYKELGNYKKTVRYAEYQAYLVDFKAKHNQLSTHYKAHQQSLGMSQDPADAESASKRLKLESETSRSTGGDSSERHNSRFLKGHGNSWQRTSSGSHSSSAGATADVSEELSPIMQWGATRGSPEPVVKPPGALEAPFYVPPPPVAAPLVPPQQAASKSLWTIDPFNCRDAARSHQNSTSISSGRLAPIRSRFSSPSNASGFGPSTQPSPMGESVPSLTHDDTSASASRSEQSSDRHQSDSWTYPSYTLPKPDSSSNMNSRVPPPLPQIAAEFLDHGRTDRGDPRPPESAMFSSQRANPPLFLHDRYDSNSNGTGAKTSLATLLRATEHVDREDARSGAARVHTRSEPALEKPS